MITKVLSTNQDKKEYHSTDPWKRLKYELIKKETGRDWESKKKSLDKKREQERKEFYENRNHRDNQPRRGGNRPYDPPGSIFDKERIENLRE